MSANVEMEASGALLDIGVSVPLREIKIPFTRWKFTPRLTMKRPCLGSQIRIARQYLKIGVTHEEIKAFTKHEELEFMAKHGRRISRIIALMICRGFVSGWLLSPVVAWVVLWFVPDVFIAGANLKFITLLGTKNFENIIKSSEIANPLRPRLSQEKEGS